MNSPEVTSITFTLFASNSPLHIFEMYCKMQFSQCGKKKLWLDGNVSNTDDG